MRPTQGDEKRCHGQGGGEDEELETVWILSVVVVDGLAAIVVMLVNGGLIAMVLL